MTETWLSWCVRYPGPPSKQGYPSASRRELSEIGGEVKHSTEGPLLAAFGELGKLDRRASWHFTVGADGEVYQHYPLEAITWHCGVAGDRWQETPLVGNMTLVGVEHVDRVFGVELATLTEEALAATARLSREIRALCPAYGSRPPTLRQNLFEHNMLSSTACPSGLIPWDRLIPMIEEEDMNEQQTRDMAIAMALRWDDRPRLVRELSVQDVYVVGPGGKGKRIFPGDAVAFTALGFDWDEIAVVPPGVFVLL